MGDEYDSSVDVSDVDTSSDSSDDSLDVPEDIEEEIFSENFEKTTEDIPENIPEDTEEAIVEDNQESTDDNFDNIPEDTESEETEVETEKTIGQIEEDIDSGNTEVESNKKQSDKESEDVKETEIVDNTIETDNPNDLDICDKNGNLRVFNNEEFLALTPEQQERFEQKYCALSKEEQEFYDKQFAQADYETYKKNVEDGVCEKDPNLERDINDIINGEYSNDEVEERDSLVAELVAKGIVSVLGSAVKLDPMTKNIIGNQAGEFGKTFGPTIMRGVVQTAHVQHGIHTPTPIVHVDEFGNKSYDYGGDTGKDEKAEQVYDQTDKNCDWDNRITDYIRDQAQMDIYRKADLKQAEINDRMCLIKDIDYDYVDEKTGLTNRELMAKGRSPIDSITNEKIELHHIGQEFDSPFAELTENSEHGDGNHKVLHPKVLDSWRNDKALKKEYNNQKTKHWITRSMMG